MRNCSFHDPRVEHEPEPLQAFEESSRPGRTPSARARSAHARTSLVAPPRPATRASSCWRLRLDDASAEHDAARVCRLAELR